MRSRSFSNGAASVVVIGVDQRGMGLIRECLGTEAVLPTHSTPYEDALQVVPKTRPNVVVMGFDEDFDEAVRLGSVLGQSVSNVQLVAISERTDPERIRAAMRAGYREYVVLPEDGALLRQAVHEAAYTSGPEEAMGQVFAVVGAKGGCGTTFLTINLAAELTPIHRVCVADFDFSMGDVASFLDLQPSSSVIDVMHNLDRLDERMLSGSVAVHRSKVHVLAQPTELIEPEEVRSDDMLRVLTALAEAYQFVLVDCATTVDEASVTATTVADLVFLVCTPDVPSVKDAWRRLQLMERMGIERNAVRLLVNRWGKNAGLSLQDIETNLGLPVAATIAEDVAAVSQAVNVGQLLRDVDKRSPTARDLGETIALMTDGAERVETATTSRRFWGIFG